MRFKSYVVLAVAALAVWMVMPGTASAHGTHQKAKMTGDQVVGQSGAPNGSGTVRMHLLRKKGKVCFKVKYSAIGSRKGLDVAVYKGRKGENGSLEFTLVDEDLKSPIEECLTGISKKVLKKITRNPRRYHATVKTDKYSTDGAIRGQFKGI